VRGLRQQLAGALERHLVRKAPIAAQGQHLLHALPILRAHRAVLQPPELAAGGHDLEVQAPAVEALIGLRAGFERADRAIGELLGGHGGAPAGPLREAKGQTPHTVTGRYRHRRSYRHNEPFTNSAGCRTMSQDVPKYLFLLDFASARDTRKH